MKLFRTIQSSVCFAMVAIWGFLLFGFFSVPNEIIVTADAVPKRSGIYSMESAKQTESGKTNRNETRDLPVTVKFLGTFPVKNSVLKVNRRQYVDVCGEVFGLRMYTSGVVIVSTDQVDTPRGSVSPAERAGLKKGDILLEVDHEPVNSHAELSAFFSEYQGKAFDITYERDGQRRTTTFMPAYSASRGKYMAGMWVRDSAAGIGTMTFCEPQSHVFAGLGHAVCDMDTGEKLPLYNGDIVKCEITGCFKGTSGRAGELCGSFKTEPVGALVSNDLRGIYGFMDHTPDGAMRMPVAVQSEVKTGKAKILATVDEEGPKLYDVEIEKLSLNDAQDRNMVLRVTDSELLSKTGGIVQGMSGSPVLQNDMLVGAVTHVFVNEPQRGYAIFSELMMERAKIIVQAAEKAAS